jgi:hypothetical protein
MQPLAWILTISATLDRLTQSRVIRGKLVGAGRAIGVT